MADLKIQHLLTLSYLLSKGAKSNYITITTSSLAKEIGKSQQAASKHLLDLEKGGFIERIITGRKVSVKITTDGSIELKKIFNLLKKNLELSPSVELNGKLVSGLGEGAYYMSLKGYTKQFIKKIGYVPYPGTLNIRLDDKKFSQIINQLDEDFISTKIDSFSDKNRTYGWVKCYDAKLNNLHACKLIRLERTHHDSSIIEFISKHNLRKTAKLKTGSKMKIKIFTSN